MEPGVKNDGAWHLLGRRPIAATLRERLGLPVSGFSESRCCRGLVVDCKFRLLYAFLFKYALVSATVYYVSILGLPDTRVQLMYLRLEK